MTHYSRGAFLAVTGTVFYGLIGLAIKFSGESASVWQMMASRGLLGVFLVAAIARFMGIRLWTNQTMGMLLTAFFNFSASSLITVALTTIPIFEALVLWYLLPAWTTLLAAKFLGERITRIGSLFLLMAIAGAVIVLWPANGMSSFGLHWGHLAGLCSSLSAALGFVSIRHYSGHHGLSHFFHFCLVTLVLSSVLQLFSAGPFLPPAVALTGITMVAILGGLGQMLMFASVAYLPPAGVTVISMGEIVVAGIGAYVIFNETITLTMLCGGAMIVGGALGINLYGAYLAKQLAMATAGEEIGGGQTAPEK